MQDSDRYARFMGAMPVLAILMADGLWAAWGRVKSRLSPPRQRAALAAALLLIVGGQLGYYAVLHLPLYNHEFRLERPYPDVEDAVLRALDLPPETQMTMITRFRGNPVDVYWGLDEQYTNRLLRYLSGGTHRLHMVHEGVVSPAFLALLTPGGPRAFFLPAEDEARAQLLRRWFVLEGPFYSPYPDVPRAAQFALYVTR